MKNSNSIHSTEATSCPPSCTEQLESARTLASKSNAPRHSCLGRLSLLLGLIATLAACEAKGATEERDDFGNPYLRFIGSMTRYFLDTKTGNRYQSTRPAVVKYRSSTISIESGPWAWSVESSGSEMVSDWYRPALWYEDGGLLLDVAFDSWTGWSPSTNIAGVFVNRFQQPTSKGTAYGPFAPSKTWSSYDWRDRSNPDNFYGPYGPYAACANSAWLTSGYNTAKPFHFNRGMPFYFKWDANGLHLALGQGLPGDPPVADNGQGEVLLKCVITAQ